MLRKLKQQAKGFTIIEVMIVLLIAAVIMLIVFLAVPQLNRNSRNTQAKNAAASILATINEFVTNNNGAQPTGCSVAADGTISITGAAGSSPATGKTQGGYTCAPGAALPAAGAAAGAYTMILANKCNGNNALTATPRAIAIGFTVESGSTTVTQCVDS